MKQKNVETDETASTGRARCDTMIGVSVTVKETEPAHFYRRLAQRQI